MLALSIKNPYAYQILTGDKKIEYRTWPAKNVNQFLLVSSGTPSSSDFGLGLPNGYALAIVKITSVSENKDIDGYYHWHISPVVPVEPFKVKGKLHFYDVDDQLVKHRDDLIDSMEAFWRSENDPVAAEFNNYLAPLLEIGIKQMPKKYQKILKETNGDWYAVGKAWSRA